jgi:hypothetical protein
MAATGKPTDFLGAGLSFELVVTLVMLFLTAMS